VMYDVYIVTDHGAAISLLEKVRYTTAYQIIRYGKSDCIILRRNVGEEEGQ
jgi:hypothetical protein